METIQKIYIYHTPTTSNGILVIINNLHEAFIRNGYISTIITSLDGVPHDSFIIPYASDAAMNMIKGGYRTELFFMTDAYSLGHLNKVKFYLRRCKLFEYDLYRSLYCFIEGRIKESKIFRHFKQFILVSDVDIEYLKNTYNKNAICYCLPNGANYETITPKEPSKKIRFGILSSWVHRITAGENAWFINDYFKKYNVLHPEVELVLAGKGEHVNDYKDVPGVRIMGEVESLNDFFKECDIFIVANPKGCGILNRTLDAFAHKTCVLGFKASFTGFDKMENSYLEFNDYSSFEQQANKLSEMPALRNELAENAFAYIKEHNDWVVNYDGFIKQLFG